MNNYHSPYAHLNISTSINFNQVYTKLILLNFFLVSIKLFYLKLL